MNEQIKQQIKTNKSRAEYYYENNDKIFIKSPYGDLRFAEIKVGPHDDSDNPISEEVLHIYNFIGDRKGIYEEIEWIDIKIISKYKPLEEPKK